MSQGAREVTAVHLHLMRVCKAELLSDFHTFADETSSSDLGILFHGQRLVQGMAKMKRTVHPGETLAIQFHRQWRQFPDPGSKEKSLGFGLAGVLISGKSQVVCCSIFFNN